MAKVASDLGLHASLSPQKTVVRLGVVHVTALPKMASAAAPATASP